jgi:hypothetical protein
VAPHGGGDTFTIKTLKTMIEVQALWTENDLIRLGIVKTRIGRPNVLHCARGGVLARRCSIRADHAGVCERLIVQDRKRLGRAGALTRSIDLIVAHAEACFGERSSPRYRRFSKNPRSNSTHSTASTPSTISTR